MQSGNGGVRGPARALTVGEIAAAVGGVVAGDSAVPILGVAAVSEAEHGDIVFAESQRYLGEAERSRASAVVASLDAAHSGKPLIRVENPRYAFARILSLFSPTTARTAGVDPSALIGSGARVSPTATVGPLAVVGENAEIGEGTAVLAGCRIGDNVRIGDGCVLHPNVVVYADCTLGSRVVVHAGAVIGSDGFGFVRIGDRAHKVPHVGIVEIEDDVEIGANTTIDRAKTGSTVVGARTKIDNLVQIAHNVKIGPDCVIAALVGIAGSVRIGQRVVIAGQAGIKDHVTIGDGAVLLGGAGVWGDVGATCMVSGSPAKPHRVLLKQLAVLDRGADTQRAVRALQARVAELTERLAAASGGPTGDAEAPGGAGG